MVFEIAERPVNVADLQIGMFVCRLDRPWEETPFPLQGIELSDLEEIEALRRYCNMVYIDARRTIRHDPYRALTRTELSGSRFTNTNRYADLVELQDEAPRARAALENASRIIRTLLEDTASGQELSIEHVEQAVRPLVASVLRSADAFFLVESLRRHDSHSYSHAINCSALAAAFGRHLGFDEETIFSLAAGGLLMDVGKTQLPESLLHHPGPLAPIDTEAIRSHVEHGLAIIARSDITNQDVLDIVRTHHERHDGSGYPAGLGGQAIPVSGRMLGIIDAYDAIASARPYHAAVSRHQALRQIYAAGNSLFQAAMVEQFQVCLGVYPTGSLVELSTGEVAIVMAQNQVRRLRPQVAIVSTPDKQPLAESRPVDLIRLEGKAAVDIVRGISADDYDIGTSTLFLS